MKVNKPRGRKKLTPAEKVIQNDKQTQRVKIANLVRRKPEIKNECCICGNKGMILHNFYDPYYITFICQECRKDPNNLVLAEERRFDIRTKLDKSNINITNFTDQEVTRIVIGYMNLDTKMSIGEYCDSVGITRYQFNNLVNRYEKVFPNHKIKEKIKNISKEVQKERVIAVRKKD